MRITFLNINLFMSNPDAIEDDIYEDILNLLEKGEKSGLKHKYSGREKRIWRVCADARFTAKEVKTELTSDSPELRIVSNTHTFFLFLIRGESHIDFVMLGVVPTLTR